MPKGSCDRLRPTRALDRKHASFQKQIQHYTPRGKSMTFKSLSVVAAVCLLAACDDTGSTTASMRCDQALALPVLVCTVAANWRACFCRARTSLGRSCGRARSSCLRWRRSCRPRACRWAARSSCATRAAHAAVFVCVFVFLNFI